MQHVALFKSTFNTTLISILNIILFDKNDHVAYLTGTKFCIYELSSCLQKFLCFLPTAEHLHHLVAIFTDFFQPSTECISCQCFYYQIGRTQNLSWCCTLKTSNMKKSFATFENGLTFLIFLFSITAHTSRHCIHIKDKSC